MTVLVGPMGLRSPARASPLPTQDQEVDTQSPRRSVGSEMLPSSPHSCPTSQADTLPRSELGLKARAGWAQLLQGVLLSGLCRTLWVNAGSACPSRQCKGNPKPKGLTGDGYATEGSVEAAWAKQRPLEALLSSLCYICAHQPHSQVRYFCHQCTQPGSMPS